MNKFFKQCVKHSKSCAAIFILISMAMSATSMADEQKTGDFANGSKAWADNCARCHNLRSPSELSDEQWVTSAYHMRVRAGLTGQETRDILTFLQAANDKVQTTSTTNKSSETGSTKTIEKVNSELDAPVATDEVSLETGKTVFQSSCVACHGADGKGVLPGTPDFTDKNGVLTKAQSELFNNVINGFQTEGNAIPMPPKGGNAALTDEEIAAVLQYLKQSFGNE